MTFTSFSYLLFLPLVFLASYTLGDRARLRQLLLLLASIVFYGWLGEVRLLLALVAVTAVTYAMGIRIADTVDEHLRRFLVGAGVTGNLLILISVKYLPVVMGGQVLAPGATSSFGSVVVAIGVSYYVFQAISYLMDIHLGLQVPERQFHLMALYLAFFPKLMQGPIERAGDLLPQLRHPTLPSVDTVRSGLFLFGLGLFKKVVIADRLASMVDPVYDSPHSFTGLHFLIATVLYSLQIYLDFSGYTDMALGSARLFNIRLTQNFNRPYLATSVVDFWRRWHISFSRWLLDYLFRPLQMAWRDYGKGGTSAALLVTFTISGLWHGAGMHFVVWGVLHGSYLAVSVWYRPYQKRCQRMFGLDRMPFLVLWQRLFTFLLIAFAWIFFRSRSLQEALYIVSHLFSGIPALLNRLAVFSGDGVGLVIVLKTALKPLAMRQGGEECVIAFAALAILWLFNRLYYRFASVEELLEALPAWQRWGVYHVLAIGNVFFGAFNQGAGFIYYQF